MTENIFEAGTGLSDVINYFYVVSGLDTEEKRVKHLLPNFEMILVFNMGPPVPISFKNDPFEAMAINQVAVIGPLKRKLNYELPAACELLIVNFTLNGFYRLFGVPFEVMQSNNLTDPDELSNSKNFSLIWGRLKEISNVTERISVLKGCLSVLLNQSEPASEALLDGRHFFDDPTKQPVKAIAAKNKLAERTIQLRFKKYLGYSTKELLRFKRFKSLIQHLLSLQSEKINWPGLASCFGYYDQSHLIKDFQYFLDTTPEYFVSQADEFCIIQDTKYEN